MESERSIRGYKAIADAYGYPLTLFAHPEVAAAHRELLLELQSEGACLGLHLHPYKFADGRYTQDLGLYSASMQREILGAATAAWAITMDQAPHHFRAGFFSANDSTFGELRGLGFKGGSLSNPGRVLPEHGSLWAGADAYPHRSHLSFRQLPGKSDFIEVPVSVDYLRPVEMGAAGEQGYEWLYIPAHYHHEQVVKDLVARARADAPPLFPIVLDTHNDQDYFDSGTVARQNLDLILATLEQESAKVGLEPVGATVETVCELVRARAKNGLG
ncbi:MAG: hypothetical protein MUQ10_01665 [Anaerolineae bacterium]|nr:hypothetical protein [Anaerolineae bacterium]